MNATFPQMHAQHFPKRALRAVCCDKESLYEEFLNGANLLKLYVHAKTTGHRNYDV